MSTRRTLAIVAAATAVLVCAWLALRASKTESGPRIASPTLSPADEAKVAEPAALESVARAETARSEIPVAPAPASKPAPSAEAATPPAADAATLIVSVVSKEDRAPLAHVRVHVHPSSQSEYSWTNLDTSSGDVTHAPISDARGRVEITVPPKEKLSIRASDESAHCGPTEKDIEPLAVGERREIVLDLPCGNDGRYFGRVIDRESREPVSGAHVQVMHEKGWTQGPDGEGNKIVDVTSDARTDAAGRFEISFAVWMRPYLRIDREGYGLLVAPTHPGHERPDQAEDILASRAASLHARVVDAAGHAMAGAAVVLKAEGYTLVSRREEGEAGFSNYVAAPDEKWRGECDASGQCTISNLPPRVSLDVAILQGNKVLRRGADSLQLEPGQLLDRTWTIGSGCRVEGVMIDQDRKPVTKQAVLLFRREWPAEKYMESYEAKSPAARAKTDDQGKFALDDVAEGQWWLCAEPRDDYGPAASDAIASKTQSIEVPAGGTMSVLLSVSRGLFIRGTVLDPDGKPVKQAYVQAQQSEAWIGLQSHGDEAGVFALGPLAPGTCKVWAMEGEHASSEPVEAEPGRTDLVLHLRRGARISGRAVDAAGKGVVTTLHVQPEHARATPMGNGFETSTSEDGQFHLQGLEPDRYFLAFTTPDGLSATLPWIDAVADQESSGHVATLAPGAKLAVHYEGKENYAQLTILLDGGALSFPAYVASEKVETVVVPAAHLTLEYHIGENGPVRTMSVDVTAGETRDVVLKDGG